MTTHVRCERKQVRFKKAKLRRKKEMLAATSLLQGYDSRSSLTSIPITCAISVNGQSVRELKSVPPFRFLARPIGAWGEVKQTSGITHIEHEEFGQSCANVYMSIYTSAHSLCFDAHVWASTWFGQLRKRVFSFSHCGSQGG